jgi:hypothetical protein
LKTLNPSGVKCQSLIHEVADWFDLLANTANQKDYFLGELGVLSE